MDQKLADNVGLEIYELAQNLWSLNRSITGDGVRATLKILKRKLPDLQICEIPSGTKVFDWSVPEEWNVNEAYILDPDGNRICDFNDNNLHLVGYSVPVNVELSLNELQGHLHSLPEQPDAIPYVTSYYEKRWGFCITENERRKLKTGKYRVVIDSSLTAGSLTYGELIVRGKSDTEIFLSTYICHPSMANNELSGICVTTFLANWITSVKPNKFTYRIVFLPETIGSIAYLSKYHETMKKKVFAGFNITCVGDDRSYSFLPSRAGDTISDKIAKHVLKFTDPDFIQYSWLDRGSDERQYCSPGIDLPIASIMRSKYGAYPEYHTSKDDLINVVSPSGLEGGYLAIQKALIALEKNVVYKCNFLCEPHLSKYGLYSTTSIKQPQYKVDTILDVLSMCDGKTTLLDIADSLNLPIWDIFPIINQLENKEIINEA